MGQLLLVLEVNARHWTLAAVYLRLNLLKDMVFVEDLV
jgi:hypothetical protein